MQLHDRMQGQNVALKTREEWCLISETLFNNPPTTKAFTENVHRCHIQVAIWEASLIESPPEIDSTKYSWELDHLGILVPRTVPPATFSAPPDILQLIHCNCKASGCRLLHDLHRRTYYSSFTATARPLGAVCFIACTAGRITAHSPQQQGLWVSHCRM